MISVIVAIYNVEEYLEKCLDSLAAQDFADVEFILVDDGSTDKSGEIAEKYADSKFRVFHTMNQGLSAARNFGLDHARGEWIMFVDGDDWVAPGFCSIPYCAASDYDADIVCFLSYKVENGQTYEYRPQKSWQRGVVSEETALEFGRFAAWNKLYKRYLFDTVRYPEGKVYEDICTTHKLIHLSKRTVFITDYLYYQLYRKSSISHLRSARNKRDWLTACLQRNQEIESYGFINKRKEKQLGEAAIAYLISSNPVDDPVYKEAELIATNLVKWPNGMNWKKKQMINLWRYNRPLFHFVCKALRLRDIDCATI